MGTVWTVFVLMFLIASLPTNLTFILIFIFVELGFLFVAASYFAAADDFTSASRGLKQTGGVFCFLAGLVGWYVCSHKLRRIILTDRQVPDAAPFN